ncbi:NAD(P)H-binding protein [Microbispora sp. ATCC PTA-5024]|uniref:NAD(P)H-binding protein n=1 Tax=Microbispora sp. ATCC PTA-5024 TaxID=316330 RepID=UPI0004033099|nr:NAD(P)H-binding protein [Microbispora sp. ATCC PTA-5024]
MILVTGATGTVGRQVVRLLEARGEHVRAMSRDPARARLPPGVPVVRGDFDDGESLRRAADGAAAVFLLDAPGPWIPRHDAAMVAAAVAAGVPRLVKLSAIGTGEPADGEVGGWHAAGESAVASSGARWTLVRPSSFASNALSWADAVRAGEPVPNLTGRGAQGVVDPRDVAEVAAEALTSPAHDGRTYTLTGPDLLSVHDQALLLERVLGRRIGVADVPPDVARERMLASGLDPAFVEVAVRGQRLVAAGGNARLTGDVAALLGRPPRTFEDWARDHRDAFA